MNIVTFFLCFGKFSNHLFNIVRMVKSINKQVPTDIYLILVKVVLASALNQIESSNYLPVLTYFTRGQI